jgi:hypothetical protein
MRAASESPTRPCILTTDARAIAFRTQKINGLRHKEPTNPDRQTHLFMDLRRMTDEQRAPACDNVQAQTQLTGGFEVSKTAHVSRPTAVAESLTGVALSEAGEDDLLLVRGATRPSGPPGIAEARALFRPGLPCRRGLLRLRGVREARLRSTVHVHDVELFVAVAVADEGDLRAVG